MPRIARTDVVERHPENVMDDPGEIARFYGECSDLMRHLLDALVAAPDERRTFPEIEQWPGWPRRRISSVLGGVWHLRTREFDGRRPYHVVDENGTAYAHWEIWADTVQADALRAAQQSH